MMTQEEVLKVIQETLDSLARSGLIAQPVTAQEDTVLLGRGAIVDSIGFVTFMTELEDRISQKEDSEVSVFALVLQDIHEFNPEDSQLAVGTLQRYIVKLTGKPEAGHD
jgi:acyl carrier protein